MEFKTKIKRRIAALKEFLANSKARSTILKKFVEILYEQNCIKQYKIPRISFDSLIDEDQKNEISSFLPKNGNMSMQEIVVLSALVKRYNPQRILEIGTFNGLSTLNMALNTCPTTTIHTLDLDPNTSIDLKSCWKEDLKFIFEPTKHSKVYNHWIEKNKIHEHLGNSLEYDFSVFGRPDFIFIDGGHSYEIIANDTAKALDILADQGIVVWHDYSCHVEGVFRFLNELQDKISLIHLEDTSLVLFFKH